MPARTQMACINSRPPVHERYVYSNGRVAEHAHVLGGGNAERVGEGGFTDQETDLVSFCV